MQDREAFQEMDYRRVFGEMAKWVAQIDDPARLPEFLSRAWETALSGRPGPVVLALPEDMLREAVTVDDLIPRAPVAPAPNPAAIRTFEALMARAKRPLLLVGGPRWSAETARKAAELAEQSGLPMATSYRRQDYVDNGHPYYVGALDIAPVPKLRARIRDEVDVLILVGARLSEMTTQGYSLIDIPEPQMTFVLVYPGAEDLGHVYNLHLSIHATAETFFGVLPNGDGRDRWADWVQTQRKDYKAFCVPTDVPGPLNMGQVIAHLTETMPPETILSNGAGNYTVWAHRFHMHRRYRTQLAPTSGAMGYGVPAAIAAKIVAPDRPVISLSGDGCFLMTTQEMATARQ